MTRKDASAYNIQFRQGKPVLIDSLSFEIYQAGQPWIAYKQFCEHFLAPLAYLASFFSRLGRWLIIEFILKQDSQVQCLLQTRLDIFEDYHLDGFEAAFQECFSIREKKPLPDSLRVLYLMESKALYPLKRHSQLAFRFIFFGCLQQPRVECDCSIANKPD